jgi:hypothetical protein
MPDLQILVLLLFPELLSHPELPELLSRQQILLLPEHPELL